MNKDTVELEGVVTFVQMGGKFKVALENNKVILCTLSGKMRINNIKVIVGDKVRIEVGSYDLTKGRIVYRYKN